MKREAQSGIFINECASPPILGSKLFLLLFYKTIDIYILYSFFKKHSPRKTVQGMVTSFVAYPARQKQLGPSCRSIGA